VIGLIYDIIINITFLVIIDSDGQQRVASQLWIVWHQTDHCMLPQHPLMQYGNDKPIDRIGVAAACQAHLHPTVQWLICASASKASRLCLCHGCRCQESVILQTEMIDVKFC
jgi:hypothetical protein